MIPQTSLLVMLVCLVDRIPAPPPPTKPGRGRPSFYPDRLFLKALVIMIVKHLHSPYELLSVLQQFIEHNEAMGNYTAKYASKLAASHKSNGHLEDTGAARLRNIHTR